MAWCMADAQKTKQSQMAVKYGFYYIEMVAVVGAVV